MDQLIPHIKPGDLLKLQEAGLHTIEAVAFSSKKRLQDIGISEINTDKILVRKILVDCVLILNKMSYQNQVSKNFSTYFRADNLMCKYVQKTNCDFSSFKAL